MQFARSAYVLIQIVDYIWNLEFMGRSSRKKLNSGTLKVIITNNVNMMIAQLNFVSVMISIIH